MCPESKRPSRQLIYTLLLIFHILETEWFVDPELSASHDADAGHSVFTEDCFETQSRNSPISNWGADGDAPYTNVRGDTIEPRDEIECPEVT